MLSRLGLGGFCRSSNLTTQPIKLFRLRRGAEAIMHASQAESIPDWVPESVRNMARAIEIGKRFGRRLLTDNRMKAVWRELQAQGKNLDKDKFARDRSLEHMEKWGLSTLGVSVADQACAAFYGYAVIELGVPKIAMTQSALSKIIEPWRSAAKLCRWLAADSPTGRPNEDIEKALLTSAAYLDEGADFIENANRSKPYFLPRSTGKRGVGDDLTRGYVRALALGTRAIFGKFLYGTLATTASVALNKSIDRKTVEDWCSDLRSR